MDTNMLILAAFIALGIITWQWIEIYILKRSMPGYSNQKKENTQLKEENELLRAASGEIYNCGYSEGSADAFKQLSESVVQENGKLKIQLIEGE